MQLKVLRDKNNWIILTYDLNQVEIVNHVIEIFKIHLAVSFRIIKIDDVAYEKLFNLWIYDRIRDKLFKSNDMLIIILAK